MQLHLEDEKKMALTGLLFLFVRLRRFFYFDNGRFAG